MDDEEPVQHETCRCGEEHPVVDQYSQTSGQTYSFIDCPTRETSYLVAINGEPLKGYQDAVHADG